MYFAPLSIEATGPCQPPVFVAKENPIHEKIRDAATHSNHAACNYIMMQSALDAQRERVVAFVPGQSLATQQKQQNSRNNMLAGMCAADTRKGYRIAAHM